MEGKVSGKTSKKPDRIEKVYRRNIIYGLWSLEKYAMWPYLQIYSLYSKLSVQVCMIVMSIISYVSRHPYNSLRFFAFSDIGSFKIKMTLIR